jgi:hypothetical protein
VHNADNTVHRWPRWSTLTDAARRDTAVAFEEMARRGEDWTEAFMDVREVDLPGPTDLMVAMRRAGRPTLPLPSCRWR